MDIKIWSNISKPSDVRRRLWKWHSRNVTSPLKLTYYLTCIDRFSFWILAFSLQKITTGTLDKLLSHNSTSYRLSHTFSTDSLRQFECQPIRFSNNLPNFSIQIKNQLSDTTEESHTWSSFQYRISSSVVILLLASCNFVL